jgi:tRNA (guanine37-N1)-methyltransferase
MTGYDILGNIAIVKFDRKMRLSGKKKFASQLMRENKQVRTVLEKAGKFSGRLRTQKGKYIIGEKTKEALYKENGCEFRFNVDTCYFSPRLASERKEIASMIKKGESVLVMFGGVAPFAIVIGKLSQADRVVSVELGRECSKYALQNVKRNKLNDRVEIIQGDVRKVCLKMVKDKKRFDRIVMARPNLKDDFLDTAFPLVKKGTIYYYGFYDEDKLDDLRELIEKRAKEAKKRIKIIGIKKAGDIGVKKFRYRADVNVG